MSNLSDLAHLLNPSLPSLLPQSRTATVAKCPSWDPPAPRILSSMVKIKLDSLTSSTSCFLPLSLPMAFHDSKTKRPTFTSPSLNLLSSHFIPHHSFLTVHTMEYCRSSSCPLWVLSSIGTHDRLIPPCPSFLYQLSYPGKALSHLEASQATWGPGLPNLNRGGEVACSVWFKGRSQSLVNLCPLKCRLGILPLDVRCWGARSQL